MVPYDEFAVVLPRSQLHRLPQLLDAVGPGQLAALQAGLARWHRWASRWQGVRRRAGGGEEIALVTRGGGRAGERAPRGDGDCMCSGVKIRKKVQVG